MELSNTKWTSPQEARERKEARGKGAAAPGFNIEFLLTTRLAVDETLCGAQAAVVRRSLRSQCLGVPMGPREHMVQEAGVRALPEGRGERGEPWGGMHQERLSRDCSADHWGHTEMGMKAIHRGTG